MAGTPQEMDRGLKIGQYLVRGTCKMHLTQKFPKK